MCVRLLTCFCCVTNWLHLHKLYSFGLNEKKWFSNASRWKSIIIMWVRNGNKNKRLWWWHKIWRWDQVIISIEKRSTWICRPTSETFAAVIITWAVHREGNGRGHRCLWAAPLWRWRPGAPGNAAMPSPITSSALLQNSWVPLENRASR